MGVQDRVVLVTGAAQGIGRAFALRFAQEGARVAAADVNGEKAGAVAEEVMQQGGEGIAVTVDVSDPASTRKMAASVVERLGRLDVLVNGAAIFSTIRMGPFEQITPDEWNGLMAVNLTGVFYCCQAVAPQMRAQQHGRIVNISSATVLMGRPFYAHYVASKAGVIGLTRALANELGADRVTVNAIMPGSVETEVRRDTVTPVQAQAIVDRQAIHRRITPDDLVATALYLASDEAGLITGQSINVDGGLCFQ